MQSFGRVAMELFRPTLRKYQAIDAFEIKFAEYIARPKIFQTFFAVVK